jgi:hypothetical protein
MSESPLLSSDPFSADSAVFTDIQPDMRIVSCTAYELKPHELISISQVRDEVRAD